MKVKLLSRVQPSATPWTTAFQAPLSMGFSRQEYWSGVPSPSLLHDYTSSFFMLSQYLSIISIFQVDKLDHTWAGNPVENHQSRVSLHCRCHRNFNTIGVKKHRKLQIGKEFIWEALHLGDMD